MTVKELKDRLEAWIKHDPSNIILLNDVAADAEDYENRCKERESAEVVVDVNGLKTASIATAYGKYGYLDQENKDVFSIFLA